MWSWTWFITLNATQIKGSVPQNHCISQLKSLLFLRKERLCRLNEFRWLNVFACHSGVKSYLMADTQFMAGPPLSQWQVTFVTGKALSERKAKDRHYIREKELKHCAWEMKLEKSSWFTRSNTGLATDRWPHCARLGPLFLFSTYICFSCSRRGLISFQSPQTSCLGVEVKNGTDR